MLCIYICTEESWKIYIYIYWIKDHHSSKFKNSKLSRRNFQNNDFYPLT